MANSVTTGVVGASGTTVVLKEGPSNGTTVMAERSAGSRETPESCETTTGETDGVTPTVAEAGTEELGTGAKRNPNFDASRKSKL